MMDATRGPLWTWRRSKPAARAVTRPDPPKRAGPVFIQDAITPLAGETLLLSILRAQDQGDAEE